jgi:hypothetical protein
VKTGSPLIGKDAKAGDWITHINGRPTDKLSFDSVKKLLDSARPTVSLTLSRLQAHNNDAGTTTTTTTNAAAAAAAAATTTAIAAKGRGSEEHLLFIAHSDSERHLYSAIKHRVVDDRAIASLDSSLLDKVKTHLCGGGGASGGALNLRLVSVGLTADLLDVFSPLLHCEDASGSPEVSPGFAGQSKSVLVGLELGKAFWEYLRDQSLARGIGGGRGGGGAKPHHHHLGASGVTERTPEDGPEVCVARRFFGFPILFDALSRPHPLLPKTEHSIIQGGGFPSDRVVAVVEQLGGVLLSSGLLPLIPAPVRALAIHDASAEGVLAVCVRWRGKVEQQRPGHGGGGGGGGGGGAGGGQRLSSADGTPPYGMHSALEARLEQRGDKETLVQYLSFEAHKLVQGQQGGGDDAMAGEALAEALRALPIYELVESTPASPAYVNVTRSGFLSFPAGKGFRISVPVLD